MSLTRVGLIFVAVACLAADVMAGGLKLPDNSPRAMGRAGAFIAKADDLTAIYFNPATLAIKSKGHQLHISGALPFLQLSFRRLGNDPESGKRFKSVNSTPRLLPVPYLIVSSDFGLEDWTFAFGVMAPHSAASKRFPETGPQRYAQVETDMALVMYTWSFAYRVTKNFSIGGSFIWADAFRIRARLIVDGSIAAITDPTYVSGEQRAFDVPIQLEAKDRYNFTGILGFWYRPHRNWEIGLSGMVAPINLNAKGTIKPDWPIDNPQYPDFAYSEFIKNGSLKLTDTGARVISNLPMDIKLGVRYRHMKGDHEVFDVEIAIVYEAWSVLKRQRIVPKGGVELFGNVTPLPTIEIPKNYRDTVSVRIGGDWNVWKYITLRAGFMYESPAVPRKYTNIDFLNFHRFGMSVGMSVEWKWLRFTAAYMSVIQPVRNIAADETAIRQVISFTRCAPPYNDASACDPTRIGHSPGNPVGAGRYKANYHMVAIGFELFFDKMF